MGAAHGGQVLAVAGGRRRWSRERLPRRRRAARSRQRPAARPRDARARLPGRAPAAARRFPGAALARGDAEQPAAAADVVHRPRARARARSRQLLASTRLLTLLGIGRPRQDAAVAAGRAPTCSTTIPTACGSSSWRRSPIARSCRRRSRACSACKEEPAGGRCSRRWRKSSATAQLLLILDNCEHLIERVRRARRRAAARRARGRGSSPRAASRCASPASRRIRCRRSPIPAATAARRAR